MVELTHWIVVSTFTEPDSGAETLDDEWQAYETYEEACAAYATVIENGAYSASVCAVVKSTDYTPHPDFADIDDYL